MKKITLMITLMLTSLGFSQELTTNGDFQTGNGSAWIGNAVNVLDYGTGDFFNEANVATAGNPWDVNLSQVLPLTGGKTYTLKFDAWTGTGQSKTIVAGIGLNQGPWDSSTKTVTLTPTRQTFNLLLVNPTTSSTCRIIFDMGASVGYVGIDNVSLVETAATCSDGLKNGDETGVDCGGASCPVCPQLGPTVAASTPPARATADVFSIYSGAYTNVASTFDAGWCGAGSVSEVMVAGNATESYLGNGCQGIDFQANKIDASLFTNLHIDFYTTETNLVGKVFNLKLVNFGSGSSEIGNVQVNINTGSTPAIISNGWVSVDVPVNLSAFTGLAQAAITSNLNNTVWYDNFYLYKGTALGTANFEKSNISVYPNPATNTLNIDANNTIDKVAIYNVLGQEVIEKSPKAKNTTIDISNLQIGTYIVKTTSEGKTETTKVLKK